MCIKCTFTLASYGTKLNVLVVKMTSFMFDITWARMIIGINKVNVHLDFVGFFYLVCLYLQRVCVGPCICPDLEEPVVSVKYSPEKICNPILMRME